MITLFGCAHFFNFVSFLLYPMLVKRLKCAMLGAFTVTLFRCIVSKSTNKSAARMHHTRQDVFSMLDNQVIEKKSNEKCKMKFYYPTLDLINVGITPNN